MQNFRGFPTVSPEIPALRNLLSVSCEELLRASFSAGRAGIPSAGISFPMESVSSIPSLFCIVFQESCKACKGMFTGIVPHFANACTQSSPIGPKRLPPGRQMQHRKPVAGAQNMYSLLEIRSRISVRTTRKCVVGLPEIQCRDHWELATGTLQTRCGESRNPF